MLKRILSYISTAMALILIVLVSFWLSLSEETLLSWTQHQLARISPQQVQTAVRGMRTRVWGLEIAQIEVINPARRENLLIISNIELRFNIISIFYRQELPFSFELYGGLGAGALGLFSNRRIRLKAEKLELNWIPVVRRSQLLKSSPVLSMTGEYSTTSNSCQLHFFIRDMKLSGDKTHTTLKMSLPDTQLESFKGSVTVHKNQMELAVTTTGDITAALEGNLLGNWNHIRRSKIDVRLKVDMSNHYQDKLGALNRILDNFRTPNGQIAVHFTGNLMLPQIRKI